MNAGDKVIFIGDGGFDWIDSPAGCPANAYGIVVKVINRGSELAAVICDLYDKKTDKPTSLSREQKPWCFLIEEVEKVQQ